MSKHPHCCPVCWGHGTVQKPPWIAGDQQSWPAGDTATYPCRACFGTGIVWEIIESAQGEGEK